MMMATASAIAGQREQRRQRRRMRHPLAAEELSSTRTKPMTEHSSTLPGRQYRRYRPMNMAIGIVAAIVNVPQGLSFKRVDDHEREHRQQDDHDQQHGDQRREAADLADLLARHLAERLAVAPHGAEQDHEVLNGAAEHRADDDPQRARQIAELRGERRADERARARRSRRSDGRRRSTCSSARNRGRCVGARPGVARLSSSAMTLAAMNRA